MGRRKEEGVEGSGEAGKEEGMESGRVIGVCVSREANINSFICCR